MSLDALHVKQIGKRQRALLESGLLDQLGSGNPSPPPYQSALERLGEEYGNYITRKIPEVLKGLELKASGNLAQSVQFDLVLQGNTVALLKIYMADYWSLIHYGKKRSAAEGAKPPPLAAIMKWLSYKPVQIRQSASESTTSVVERLEATAQSIRLAIWRRGYTVKRFGPAGSQFLDKVLDQQSLDALAEMMGELGAVVAGFDILSVVPRIIK